MQEHVGMETMAFEFVLIALLRFLECRCCPSVSPVQRSCNVLQIVGMELLVALAVLDVERDLRMISRRISELITRAVQLSGCKAGGIHSFSEISES